MKTNPGRIGVIGGGSWGTALSKLLAENNNDVTLWCYEPDLPDTINETRENDQYLPDIELPENITATNDLENAISDQDGILSVMPSHVVRDVWSEVADKVDPAIPVISATKGIENESLMLISEILESLLPDDTDIAYLSGPSFAREVAERKPTAVTIASDNHDLAVSFQEAFSNDYFRAYTSTDVIGVELGGALKNVVALASGMASGMELGLNSSAGLITRGLHEITRLAVNLGADPDTLRGLSGMGDLILTCTGGLSRNRTVGEKIGSGEALDDILDDMNMVAEGIKTSRSVYQLANEYDVEMPISTQVYRILYEDSDPEKAVREIMNRKLKPEHEGYPEIKG
jgi:glycerol-3-phosphate dehydrogenase (NAD(P)+)